MPEGLRRAARGSGDDAGHKGPHSREAFITSTSIVSAVSITNITITTSNTR